MDNIELAEKILDEIGLTINSNHECNRITITEILNANKATKPEAVKSKSNDWLNAEEVERLQTVEHRYEKLRRLDPRQFKELWMFALQARKPFDEIVDEWPNKPESI